MSHLALNNNPESTSFEGSHVLTIEIETKLHYILDTLACMDSRTEQEIDRVSQSAADEDLKDFIKHDILSRHAERRLPLAAALEELRQTHRPTFAS